MADPRPLLTQVRARHFRSLGHLDLDLGPLTVLVGPNGSGKSNVVAVLRFLRDAATRGLKYAYGEQGGSVTIPQRGHSLVSLGATYTGSLGLAAYDLELSQAARPLELESESLQLDSQESYSIRRSFSGGIVEGGNTFGVLDRAGDVSLLALHALQPVVETPEGWKAAELGDALYRWVAGLGVYNWSPSSLRVAQRETYASPFEEDGRNLAATLDAIRETLDADTIDQALALLVDGAVGYHVEQAAGLLVPFLDYAGQGDGQAISSDLGLESDGTIRMVAMLAALYQTPPRSLVVLEEPEAGLHPGVLPALAEIIEEASTRYQVVVTTHSPDLIDCFTPDALRVVEKVDGETRVGPVEDVQQDAVRRKLFSPGELMRIEGLRREPGA